MANNVRPIHIGVIWNGSAEIDNSTSPVLIKAGSDANTSVESEGLLIEHLYITCHGTANTINVNRNGSVWHAIAAGDITQGKAIDLLETLTSNENRQYLLVPNGQDITITTPTAISDGKVVAIADGGYYKQST